MKEELLVYNESKDVKISADNTQFVDFTVEKIRGFHVREFLFSNFIKSLPRQVHCVGREPQFPLDSQTVNAFLVPKGP